MSRTTLPRTLRHTVMLAVAAFCFWQALAPVLRRPAVASPSGASAPAPSSERKLLTKPIQDLRPGMRVIAGNPETQGVPEADSEIIPAEWRLLRLRMDKSDGSSLDVELLRPIEWVFVQSLERAIEIDDTTFGLPRPLTIAEDELALAEMVLGKELELDLPELGASGPATVMAVLPCPEIETAREPGQRVITGTFHHSAANVIDLQIKGETAPIGTTDNHPFWSEDRQAFVEAGQLNIGEHLLLANNTHTQVTRITPHTGPPVAVYNLEIDADHTYHVGVGGVLVHNTYYSTNGLTVLGHHPGYLAKASSLSASRFNLGSRWNPTTGPASNMRFIDRIAGMRQKVLLSNPKGSIRPGSGLEAEITRLTQMHGYQWVNQWCLMPPLP